MTIPVSENVFPIIRLSEETPPATPPTGEAHLYAKADGLLYWMDDAGTEYAAGGDVAAHLADTSDAHDASAISIADAGTFYTGTDVEAALQEIAAAALLDQGAFTYLDATEAAAPSTPASGTVRVYAKSDGRVYSKDDAGVEYGPFDAAGGGGLTPTLLVDAMTLDAAGTDFADMSGWTTGGSPSNSLVTTEGYDADCQDLTFPSASDRYYKAIDSGDWTYYLTIHGVNDGTSPNSALGAMMALAAIDNSGNGTGMSVYNDNHAYMWGVTSHAYSSSGNQIVPGDIHAARAVASSSWPTVYRLAKSGSTITGGISVDGGATYKTATRTDSTTFTRIAIIRLFSGGGTNPKMRVGRFNLVP